MQLPHEQEIGDHAAAEKHGEREQQHEKISERQVLSGKRISRHHGKKDTEDSCRYRINYGINVAGPYEFIAKNQLVTVQR